MGNPRNKIQKPCEKKNRNMETYSAKKIHKTPHKNRRKKIQKTSEKNEEAIETIPWGDLPEEIVALILGKLLDVVDLIRFRAVCKNWHIDIPKDRMIKYKHHRNLPWLCNLEWSKNDPNRFECEIYNPYSRELFKTSKVVESRKYTRFYSRTIRCLGSNQGWLIATYDNFSFVKWVYFMYNPYSKEYISLPSIWDYHPYLATLSGNPGSGDCRVFVFLCYGAWHPYEHYIASYALNEEKKEWKIVFLGLGHECCGMQYMNEQLFCLFKNGFMKRYNLADGSWRPLHMGDGSHQLAMDNQRLWLAKGEGDLLVACELGFDSSECWTFYFDWTNMSWVGSDDGSLESSVIFISGNITTFVRPPFVDYDHDLEENYKDCKAYIFHESACEKEPLGYSFAEMKKNGNSFIEPPPINYTLRLRLLCQIGLE